MQRVRTRNDLSIAVVADKVVSTVGNTLRAVVAIVEMGAGTL